MAIPRTPWIVTPKSRSRLGIRLNCVKWDSGGLPDRPR
jgi:hypothetical protein